MYVCICVCARLYGGADVPENVCIYGLCTCMHM
jgi:hypothetical protein